jgi:hypothetical protein
MPEIDEAAMGSAHMAYLDAPARNTAQRIRHAIFAYLYAVGNTSTEHGYTSYPSLSEIRHAIAQYRHHQENRNA